MSELREVFDMVTKQTEPDLDSWKEQERRQRRAARSRKAGVIGLVAALIAGAILFAVTNLGSGRDGTLPVPASTGSPDIPSQAPLGLAIVGLDGTVEEDLTLPTDAWIPDMSADGTHIVFLSASKKLGFCGACGADGDRLAATPLRESSGGYIYLDTSDDIGSVENPVWCP